jgi:hypothetical protein
MPPVAKLRSRRLPLALLLVACLALSSATASAQVNPADYDAFWLWGGVTPSPALAQARILYILRGEVHADRRHDSVDIEAQGINIPHLKTAQIWLVYRANTLDWPERAITVLNAEVIRWRQVGNNVVGIQVDFDAATRHLGEYAGFLQQLRQHLAPDCRLGITGLLDVGANSDPAALDQLTGVVDELVIQTYQGHHTIPGYQAYIDHLDRLHLPFKIGLVEAGDWTPAPELAANPWFRGYVVFLINHR